MKRVSLIVIASVAVVCALLISPVEAQHFTLNQRTNITFSAPVELPGVTLPAGSYVFQFANPLNGKNVLQVLSKDGKQVMGQFFFAEAKRNQPVDDNIVTFKEAREGTTPAVQYWFYPNDIYGVEFMYSKAQAEAIASRSQTPVLSEDGRIDATGHVTQPAPSTADNSAAAAAAATPGAPGTNARSAESTVARNETQASPSTTSTDRNAAPSDLSAERNAADSRTGRTPEDPGTRAQNTPAVGTTGATEPAPTASDSAAAGQNATARTTLPRTASNIPLAGLIGLVSLIGLVGFRTLAHGDR